MFENDGNMGHSRAQLDLKLTPKGTSTIEQFEEALSNGDYYGSYFSNMRSNMGVEAAIKKHFGPSIPVQKRSAEKKQGFPFPPKTKQAVDDFIKSLNKSVDILRYSIEDNYIIFPSENNDSQQKTKNIVKTVMDNAGLDYKIEEFENLKEFRKLNEVKRLQKLAGIKEIKVNQPINYLKVFGDVYGNDKSQEYKERLLDIKKQWEYDLETWNDLKYDEEAPNLLARVISNDKLDYADEFDGDLGIEGEDIYSLSIKIAKQLDI